jgi:hypothetical protein
MNTIVMAFIFIVILIILLVVLSYASTASVDLKDLVSTDDNLKLAKQWIDYALIIIWPVWIGIVLGLIALFVFGPELIPELGYTIVYFGVIVVLLSVGLLALFCILGVYYIWSSSSTNPSKIKAQGDVGRAAGLASFTLLFVLGAWWLAYRSPKVPHPDEYPSERSSEYGPPYPSQGQPPYPSQGQPPYPSQGQPSYPQQRQPGYPQQRQPGYPQQRQPGYPQQRQSSYPQQRQSSYPQQRQPLRRPIRTPINTHNPVAPPRGRSLVNTSNISRAESFAAREAGAAERVGVEAAEVAV